MSDWKLDVIAKLIVVKANAFVILEKKNESKTKWKYGTIESD